MRRKKEEFGSKKRALYLIKVQIRRKKEELHF